MNFRKALMITAGLCVLSAGSALALGPVSVGITADYASRYIWRGFDFYDNGDAFQPSATASYAPIDPLNLSLGVWGSYDMDNESEWTEIDYTLSAAYTIAEKYTVTAGYIFYAFPNVGDSDANDTKEVFASISAALPAGLTAGLAGYYDHDDGKGYYVNAALGYSRDVSETASVGASVNAGYMNYDEDGVYAGFDGISDINLKVSGSAGLAYGLKLGVTAAYTIVPDSDINEDNEFWTLTSLTYSF